MNKKAIEEFEKVVDAISITQKFFSSSLCGNYVNYKASNKRVVMIDLNDIKVYCILDDNEFDILISTEDLVIDGDIMTINGVLYETKN